MQADGHDIGVCSWSLHPADMGDLIDQVTQLELTHLQLGLRHLLAMDAQKRAAELGRLQSSKLIVTATMISFPGEDYSSIERIRLTGGLTPDDEWHVRKELCLQSARLTQEIGVKILSFHIGFVPPSNHLDYTKMLNRVGEIADGLQSFGGELAMETGQESASELLQFLNDLSVRNVGINFDPANMILYGAGDPIAAIRTLNRHIRHVHVKDAIASKRPALEWGTEVPFGAGQVNVEQFLLALKDIGYAGPLVIEREAGPDRAADIKAAITALQSPSPNRP